MGEKIGDGHARGMGQLGLQELRNGVYTESNIAEKHPPYGVWGVPTPGEVADARRVHDFDFEDDRQGGSMVDQRLRDIEREPDIGDDIDDDWDLDVDR
jgi:hypothetical protein